MILKRIEKIFGSLLVLSIIMISFAANLVSEQGDKDEKGTGPTSIDGGGVRCRCI